MRTLRPITLAITLSILSAPALSAQEAVVAEERMTIKTYSFSDPDPVPILVRRPAIYPYFAFNGYSTEGSEQEWNVVRLENDYIRVLVLPGVGGKVYGAVEKSTGEEFVYLNSVLKFRQIAMRGPWTSGGSEFNFGLVGHTPATATPVDYLLRENPDGSVSCIVGTLDLPSRTRWSVEIRLPENHSLFELRSLWYNPSPLYQSYYVWTNNAVRTGDDLQYFYPGNKAVPHGYTVPAQPWPVDTEGRDLSWYRNNNFGGSKSHFVLGEYEDFYGGYWHDTRFGFGHWALYDDMPGKKMWIWALSGQGAIWEGLLTDTDGQYSEPQAGRLFSQSDHEFFAPYTGDVWREILFPFKEIGGLVKASPFAALNCVRTGDTVEYGICALQPLDDVLVIRFGDRELHREHLLLSPMEVYTGTVSLPSGDGPVTVDLGEKLTYTDDPAVRELTRPIDFHLNDESTAEGLFLAGEFREKQRQYEPALEKYLACIDSEPLHTRALTRVAELYCRRAEYERAFEYASRALRIAMYDPDANYVYGIVSRRLGNIVDAKETLGWAARSMQYRSSAYCQMAEILVLEGKLESALEYAERAVGFNSYNIRAREVLGIVHRKLGHADRAGIVLGELLEVDPLNHLARFELYMLERDRGKLDSFNSMIRSELPHEHYLEIAIFYAGLGLVDEAVQVLLEAPDYPTVRYWLAYLLRDMDRRESDAHLDMAEEMSPYLVFPFREETIPVLLWALSERPGGWKARYYLGLIYWGKGRVEDALTLFAECGAPDFAPFHLAMGHLERENAVAHFRKGLQIDESDWRTWHYLIAEYRRLSRPAEALELSGEATARFPDHVVIAMDRAGSLFDSGRYTECLSILQELEVLPYEGGWEAHNLFMRTQVHLALVAMEEGDYRDAVRYLEGSKEYPERLGTGEPYEADFRMQNYLESVAYERMGSGRRSREARQRVIDYTLRNWTGGGSHHYFGLLALRDGGEDESAERLVADLSSRFPRNRDVEWSIAMFTGDTQRANEIGDLRSGDSRFGIVIEAARSIAPSP